MIGVAGSGVGFHGLRPGIRPFRHAHPLAGYGIQGRSEDGGHADLLLPPVRDERHGHGQTQGLRRDEWRLKEDLLGTLKPIQVMDKAAWSSQFTLKKPGVYIFYMDPEPYWESAEDSFISHYTKVVVPAFGEEEGWDKEVGQKIEIVPLTRPFGLYAGNVFQGIVKLDGKPSPYAAVEIEFYNKDNNVEAPTEYMVTQSVKADRNGVFTYAVPKAGWWGFAALTTADFKIKKDGKDKAVEIGGVIWVYFQEWQMKK